MSRWIAIHDSILDNWIWTADKVSKAQAFIHLCIMASYKDTEISFDGHPFHIRRGQFVTSQRKLAKMWGWDVKSVNRFLKDLKKSKMIDYNTEIVNSRATLITIENYCKFQDLSSSKGNSEGNSEGNTPTNSGTNSDGNSEGIQSTNNNKYNNKTNKQIDPPDGEEEDDDDEEGWVQY